ncbi:hypothetical protein DNU06_10960 [Putridiphycobacter roseus]|uniref:TerB family tellurite resistance protein n=1 Tax=Putridiphycobacter roseus TaxID=2219161 RepID=A0A2W1NMA6_9FLAO|nr:TerB family tellurite resistance protein [Putridiphycobacter roseus]PZE16772.1 hypothetical protein DNU06_10960 [Putridiphycobacter roseus]
MSIAELFEGGERTQDKGHFKNLVLLANADGHLDDVEITLLYKLGRRIGLTYTQIGTIMDDPKQYSIIPPSSKDERFEMLLDLVRVMVIDNEIDPSETKMMERFVVQLGYRSLDDLDIESIVALIKRGEDNDTIMTELN